MPPVNGDIYGPFGLTLWPTIVSILIVGLVLGLILAYLKLRRHLALKRQQEALTRVVKPNIEQIIADALAAIERTRQLVIAGQHNIHQGAADISLITRQTFDSLMNHNTSFLSRNEIALRNLERISDTLAFSYPVEFSESQDGFNELCQSAAGVINSCR